MRHSPPALQLQRDRVLRDEFRLGGHNGAARSRLGQFVPCAEAGVVVFNGGQHQLLHELLDEGAFAGAHRAHHADQDLAAGAGTDLAADRGFQSFLFLQNGLLLSASAFSEAVYSAARRNSTAPPISPGEAVKIGMIYSSLMATASLVRSCASVVCWGSSSI